MQNRDNQTPNSDMVVSGKVGPDDYVVDRETLSNLLGKWIKRITENEVEFEDGEKINIKNSDYKLIKPLIWW